MVLEGAGAPKKINGSAILLDADLQVEEELVLEEQELELDVDVELLLLGDQCLLFFFRYLFLLLSPLKAHSIFSFLKYFSYFSFYLFLNFIGLFP
jgi:hypothetical protein